MNRSYHLSSYRDNTAEMLTKVRKHMVELKRYAESALLPSVLIYILGAFGAVCLSSTHVYLMEQAVCRRHYLLFEPLRVGNGGLMDEEMCKVPEIQSQVARIHGVFNFLNFMPALFLTGPYGRIAETLGKRFIIFLNVCSITLGSVYFTGVCYFQFPVQWIYVMPFFDIIGGGPVILSSFVYGYIAESVDQKQLSGVFYKLSATQLFVAFLAMSLSSYLLRSQVWVLCLIGIASFSMTIPVTILFPSSATSPGLPNPFAPPLFTNEAAADAAALHESSENTSLLSSDTDTTKVEYQEESTLMTIIHALTTQYMYSLSIFKDIYNSSPLSRTTLLIYFLIIFGTGIRVIFMQWASVTFNWILADVNAVTSFEMIVSGIMLLSLPIISHHFLKPKLGNSSSEVDIFITKISVLVHAVGILGMGFAPNKVAYICAITVWTLGIGWNDSLRSFVTGLTENKEAVEKLYLGIGMTETCAGMVATAAWSGAFAQVLGKSYLLLRIPFIISSGILLAVFGCVYHLARFGKKMPTAGV